MEHRHTLRFGDMIRCTVCHRTWQTDEEPPEECTVLPAAGEPFNERPRQFIKKEGWRGPGDHGQTKVRTRTTLRR